MCPRFFSILIEHTGGKFPLWLAPEQFALLPISEHFTDYCKSVQDQLAVADIRGFIDDRNETIGRKIRDTEVKKIPFMLIVGEKEVQNQTVSIRKQGEGDVGSMTIAEFTNYFKAQL